MKKKSWYLLLPSLRRGIPSLMPHSAGHTNQAWYRVFCVCVAGRGWAGGGRGTAQRHEYNEYTEGKEHWGQSGGWLPETPLTIAPKYIKHLWVNLAKYMLNLYTANDNITLEKLKEVLNK